MLYHFSSLLLFVLSTCRHFSEAVLDIYNCPSISITDSTFMNNSGTGISRLPFRANTGAVAIGLNNIDTNATDIRFIIQGCDFIGNQATAKRFFRTPDNAVFNGIYTGRGGGLGVFVNESDHNVECIISDNSFVGNYARSYGGGLFMVAFGNDTHSTFTIMRNNFTDNTACLGGGAIISTFFSTALKGNPNVINITDTAFIGNAAESGGALLYYLAYEGKEA